MGQATSERREGKGARQRQLRRTFPLLGLLLYYLALVGVASILIAFVPGLEQALVAPITVAGVQSGELLTGAPALAPPPALPGLAGRGAVALIAMLSALAATLPVAWVLMRTRRLRYDPSLVHTVIILPIVVAGVVLVVKNSLALAFSLAGIVAGVRFRQKLDEPEEAVYVLLALGIGLAAGVHALDIALIMSMVFTMIVMVFWRFDIGAIYARGRGAQLTIGDQRLLGPSSRQAALEIVAREAVIADGMKPDGVLVVTSENRDAARRAIETVVARLSTEWRITEPVVTNGLVRFDALLRLRKNADPAELVAELDARWADDIVAAEYVPLSSSSSDN